jgi:hypothetical protein
MNNIEYACQRIGIDEKQLKILFESIVGNKLEIPEKIYIFHHCKTIPDMIYDRYNWEVTDGKDTTLYLGDFDGLSDFLYRNKHIINDFEDMSDWSMNKVIKNILTNTNKFLKTT